MRDADELLHPVVVQTSVNTTAATGDDDARSHDVIDTHPGHLLLSSVGSARYKFVFYRHRYDRPAQQMRTLHFVLWFLLSIFLAR